MFVTSSWTPRKATPTRLSPTPPTPHHRISALYFAEVKIQHNEEESDITICRGTVVTVLEIITDMYNTAALKNISDCADFPQQTLK